MPAVCDGRRWRGSLRWASQLLILYVYSKLHFAKQIKNQTQQINVLLSFFLFSTQPSASHTLSVYKRQHDFR